MLLEPGSPLPLLRTPHPYQPPRPQPARWLTGPNTRQPSALGWCHCPKAQPRPDCINPPGAELVFARYLCPGLPDQGPTPLLDTELRKGSNCAGPVPACTWPSTRPGTWC